MTPRKSPVRTSAAVDVPRYNDNVNMEAVQVIADASQHVPSGIDVHVKIKFNGGDLVACEVEHLSANRYLSGGVPGPSTLVYRSPGKAPRPSPQELSVSDLKITAASRILKPPQSPSLSTQDFRVYQLIGSGAQGAVFLVQHLRNGRFYALKAIRKAVLKPSHFPFVFQEQVILKSVAGSPWFAHLRGSFEDHKNFYLLTDFYPEGDLAKRIYKRGRLEASDALPYCAQLVLALEQLHKRRIIHRDVKPANVLITRDNNLVLSDFGFSRAYALTANQQPWRLREEWAPRLLRPSPKSEMSKYPDLTRRDCGTIGYMAPEVCRGDWYTYSADIFSLGVVFFELMNGKLPFGIAHGTRDQRAVYEQMMSQEVAVRSDVDLDARTLLCWMLEKDPSRRPTLEQIKDHPWFESEKEMEAAHKAEASCPTTALIWTDSAKYATFGTPYKDGEAPHWWYNWISPTLPLDAASTARDSRRVSTPPNDNSSGTPRSILPRSLSAFLTLPALPLLTPPISMYRFLSPRDSTGKDNRSSLAVPNALSPELRPRSAAMLSPAVASVIGGRSVDKQDVPHAEKSNAPSAHGLGLGFHSIASSSRGGGLTPESFSRPLRMLSMRSRTTSAEKGSASPENGPSPSPASSPNVPAPAPGLSTPVVPARSSSLLASPATALPTPEKTPPLVKRALHVLRGVHLSRRWKERSVTPVD
ncbi:transporter [Ganoderma sinense ZZ0214-1]|uniref:Transporter n=1 Tax=Ganoderma sinense ZZ0214-1 TaxID=1077348 RepID=A0A2G8S0J7_9APHY|nr:transporter [Ganoderma sinense ZZ0214-1]